MKKFVLLQGITEKNLGQRFFSSNSLELGDPTESANGEIWYKVLGYADTVAEAQEKLRY